MPKTPKRRRPAPAVSAGFAERLRDIITGRRLTAYAVAHSAGLAPSVVSRFLSGERGLTLQTFDALASALGLRLVEGGRGRGPSARPSPGPVDAPEADPEPPRLVIDWEAMIDRHYGEPAGPVVEEPADALGHMAMDDDGAPPTARDGAPHGVEDDPIAGWVGLL